MPWGNTGDHRDFEPQRHDDGCIEVIGFTMASLVSTSSPYSNNWSERIKELKYIFFWPQGGTAGGRPRRTSSSMQGGGPHHLQDAAGAGGRGAVPSRALHLTHIPEESGQHGAEKQEAHVCAFAERVSLK